MEQGLNTMLFGDEPDCAFDAMTEEEYQEELEAIQHDEDYNEEYNPEEDD